MQHGGYGCKHEFGRSKEEQLDSMEIMYLTSLCLIRTAVFIRIDSITSITLVTNTASLLIMKTGDDDLTTWYELFMYEYN